MYMYFPASRVHMPWPEFIMVNEKQLIQTLEDNFPSSFYIKILIVNWNNITPCHNQPIFYIPSKNDWIQ